jgi:hypothetical protein
LAIPLFEWACAGCVPIFNIKPTTEAHIPIVVEFVNVRKVGVVALQTTTGGG